MNFFIVFINEAYSELKALGKGVDFIKFIGDLFYVDIKSNVILKKEESEEEDDEDVEGPLFQQMF